ncbi:flagellar biosynthesis protein FlhF [Candidatus Clostridium radicumherbarum]|uniref:Flagellar biosynthesis protein FlhF n=1 Tax=Candidatus Clostridium radicumherbarum TaxID=3381662 RepID=A0ABW8TZ22_9CLOT
MIIKRYLVNNMNEAMTRIRYELGQEAVIITQRKIRRGGIKGFFSKKILEVTAAIENTKKNEEDFNNNIAAIRCDVKNEFLSQENIMTKKEPLDKDIILQDNRPSEHISDNELIKEMQEMKNLLNDMISKKPEKPIKRTKLQIRLEDSDLNEKLIKKVITKTKAINEEIEEDQKVKLAIETMIPVAKVKMEGRIVLVGPTGVGKTTTIAKLAGRLSLLEKKKVGLITIDTYRIGAVEQLKTYADIMNIPFKVVFSLKEMEKAIDELNNCDVILVDTTGRSSKNSMQISELRAFIERVNTDNIHLVISSTTKANDINSIVEGFKVLNYNNVIITKLDETTTYGSILNILDAAKKPLSFITTGQNVPDDIKHISTNEVSNLILGEANIC